MSYDDIDGNYSATRHNTTSNDDLLTPGEEQPPVTGEDRPYVTGEQSHLQPQTRSMTRRLAAEANAIITHNVAKAVVDNVINIANPSQRQAAVLQLLGDAEEDREGLLQRLVTNVAQSSPTINLPTALVACTEEPLSFRSTISGEKMRSMDKGNIN